MIELSESAFIREAIPIFLSSLVLPASWLDGSRRLPRAGCAGWAQQTIFTATASGTIDAVSPTGAASVFRTVASGDALNDLTFDGSGNIFLTDSTSNTVDKVTPDGTVSTFVNLPANSLASGPVFGANGNLYVTDIGAHSVDQITPTGMLSTFATLPSLVIATQIATDSLNNLYVSTFQNNMERFQAERPDVLVSDIGTPGEDGYALIRKIRALAPEQGGSTLATALTAYVRAEDRLKALMAGFQVHAAKPVDTTVLLALVATLAGRVGSF